MFWEKLWIDVLLWQYWTIVRNIANFCLWFYFIYVIFKGLIWQIGDKEDVLKNLKSVLLRILVAWVWIQASWFLTSLFIDLSTITLAAVGSFPSQILSENAAVSDGIRKSMWDFFAGNGTEVAVGKIHNLFPKDASANSFTKTEWHPVTTNITEENFIDNLMPNKDDVSGPLYFLWFQILKVNQINSFGSWEKNSLKKTIINLVVQWWTTIVYSIEMGVLCVISLMRVLYLWMFIVLSPFAILLACIQKAWEKDLMKKGFVADLIKQINLKTFIAKVFQPAIIVLWFSLSMIFVTLISGVVNKDSTWSMDNFNVWWVSISTREDSESSIHSDDKTYTTKVEWNLLKFSVSHLWKWILDLMMSIITVILVYGIINLSIKIWNKIWDGQDFLSKTIDDIQKWVNTAITSVPIVPVSWYDKEWVSTKRHMSLGEVFGLWDKKYRWWLLTEWINRATWKVADRYSEQNEIIDKFLWIMDTWYLSSEEKRKIDNVMNASDVHWLEKLTGAKSVIKGFWWQQKWMWLNPVKGDDYWYKTFTNWLTNVEANKVPIESPWRKMVDSRQGTDAWNRDIWTLFSNPDYVKAYAELFELDLSANTWEALKDVDISRK